MALVREMAITYNSQAVPGTVGSSTLHLTDIHRLSKAGGQAEVTFRFVVDSPTTAALAADCETIEDTFQTVRKRLVVTLLGTASLTLDDADYTGIDVTPEISKPGERDPRFDTNTSRLYEVTITAGVPAITTDGDALRSFGYSVSYTPSRIGQFTVSGEYTGVVSPAATATATYLAEIAARVEVIRAALGWTIELTAEGYEPNLGNGEAGFSRTYKEIHFDQSASSTNHTSLIDPALAVSITEDASETDATAQPLTRATATYTVAVDRTVASSLVSVWESVCLPYVISQMEVALGSGLTLDLLDPTYNFYAHTITAKVSGLAAVEGNLLERVVVTKDKIDFGKIVRYVWPEPDEVTDETEGTVLSTPAHVYQANRVVIRTVETVTKVVGSSVPTPTVSGAGEVGDGVTAVLLSRDTSVANESRGLDGYETLITSRTLVEVFELVQLLEGAAVAGQPPGELPRGNRGNG
jgi:hypothetical protein